MLQFLYAPMLAVVAILASQGKAFAWPLLWWPWAFDQVSHLFAEQFYASTRGLWHLCHGTPLIIHADKPKRAAASSGSEAAAPTATDPAAMIISMNHRTRVDWMTMWQILPQVLHAAAPDLLAGCGLWPFGILSRLIIVLKVDVMHIPWMGWACSQVSFIFLVRDWTKDKHELHLRARQLIEAGRKPVFLIFPEGTDLSTRNLSKSLKFAEGKGQTPRFSTLFPRVKGMQAIVSSLAATLRSVSPHGIAPDIPILDLTVDYGSHTAQGELDLAKGVVSDRLDVWVQRRRLVDSERPSSGGPEPFSVFCSGLDRQESSTVQSTDSGVESWLQDSFLWREATLRQWQGMTGINSVARCTDVKLDSDGLLPASCSVSALDACDSRVRAWREAEPKRATRNVPAELHEWLPALLAQMALLGLHIAAYWHFPLSSLVAQVVYFAVNLAIVRSGGWDGFRAVVYCRRTSKIE
jgi:1-acyl-sn-glycerol-3-phosphate acyltransferase